MSYSTSDIVRKAQRLLKKYKTRDPFKLAEVLGIHIQYCNFSQQRGAYKVIQRNRYIYLNQNLPIEILRIVLLHELGHDALHRKEAAESGGFKEYKIFDINNNRMEYEANVFAAQIELDDDEFLEYVDRGYDVQQIASAMNSDVNLIALKADIMISQGYRFKRQDYQSTFLRYDK